MKEQIIFLKPVDFLFIEKGDIFKVYYYSDEVPYIKLKTGMTINLSHKRNKLNYYRKVMIEDTKEERRYGMS